MYNQGLNTPQSSQAYSVPANNGKQGAVNIYISGINTPQAYPAMTYPTPYPYPYPYYYPYYVPCPTQQPNNCVPTQGLNQPATPSKEVPEKKEPKKPTTPITAELMNALSSNLNQGSKDTRGHTAARVINLLKEDESRKNDPRFIGLLNSALNSNQPDGVKTAALAALNSGIVNGNAATAQLLNNIANQKDKYGNNALAATALTRISPTAQNLNNLNNLNYSSTPANVSYSTQNQNLGQKLNVISK